MPSIKSRNAKCSSSESQEKQATKFEFCLKEPHLKDNREEGAPCDICFINEDQEDQIDVYSYCKSIVFTVIFWFFTVLTLGAIALVCYWWPHLKLYCTHARCSLNKAERLLLVEHHTKVHHVVSVKTLTLKIFPEEFRKLLNITKLKSTGQSFNSNNEEVPSSLPVIDESTVGESITDSILLRMFELKNQRYTWDEEEGSFVNLRGLDRNVTLDYLHQRSGLGLVEQKIRQLLYGLNEITVPMQGITELIILEVLNPFYIFQLFSFALWCAYEYVSYAAAILIMSASSIIMTVIQTRYNQKKLHSTVLSGGVVSVVRLDDDSEEAVVSRIPSDQLVPGDLIVIPAQGCTLHCDAVLLSGTCLVNESILTGESVPVTKISLPTSPSIVYDSKEHGKHTLYCGTCVIKTRNPGGKDIFAVVIRTGFSTVKGELVRSILYPTPISFKFEEDSYKFIQLMAGFASVGFLYTVITKSARGVPAMTIALEALDLVTIVVPPALPAAMAVGCLSAQSRLRTNNIFCVSPRVINVAGCIDCFCFDKTGTLTEDGLDVWGVIPVNDKCFKTPVKNLISLQSEVLLNAMASCHSLSVINEKYCGDPLDIKMFEWTGWILEEPNFDHKSTTSYSQSTHTKVCPSRNSDSQEIEIVHQFPFSSSNQRMTVVTRPRKKVKETSEDFCFCIYSKGSPEVMQQLCDPNSIPKDFERKLKEYTLKGYRVLGIAYKYEKSNLNLQTREIMEKGLNFLGFIIFENRLKPQTPGVIRALQSANIRTVMVTGDNQLTGLSVARECGIISPDQEVLLVDVTPPTDVKPAQLSYIRCQTTFNDKNVTNVLDDEPQCSKAGGEADICGSEAALVLTGCTWDLLHSHFTEQVPTIVHRSAVFARMSPDQKQQLVLCLQSLGYYVGMCGDGANDCGALKAAHAGISLSEAESSVASPFTSRESTVDCVIKVIQEGRAALVTSFAIFKYMAGYSLTQFVSVMILYSMDSNLTDVQYLFADLFVISVFAFLLGRLEANSGPLVPRPPEISLFSLVPIASLIGQVAIVIVFQLVCFLSLSTYDWYEPYDAAKSNAEGPGCLENYALFSISTMQYVILAVMFCKGAPYRSPLSENWSLWVAVTGVSVFNFYLILCPNQWFQDQFQLVMPPDMTFRAFCIILCVANSILAGIYEFYVCDNLISSKIRSTDTCGAEKEKNV